MPGGRCGKFWFMVLTFSLFPLQEAWNSSLWLNYSFGVLETPSSAWVNNAYSIDCSWPGQNRIGDPGFERPSGSSCWSTVGAGPFSVNTQYYSTGAQSGQITTSANTASSYTQSWAIPTGATSSYVSFQWASRLTSGTATFKVYAGATELWSVSLTASSVPVWRQRQLSLAAYAGSTTTFKFELALAGEDRLVHATTLPGHDHLTPPPPLSL